MKLFQLWSAALKDTHLLVCIIIRLSKQSCKLTRNVIRSIIPSPFRLNFNIHSFFRIKSCRENGHVAFASSKGGGII